MQPETLLQARPLRCTSLGPGLHHLAPPLCSLCLLLAVIAPCRASLGPVFGTLTGFKYPRYLNLLLLSFGCFQLPISNLMLSLSLQHSSSHIIPDFPAPCSFVPLSNLPLLKITEWGGGGGHPCSVIVFGTEC